MTRTLLKAAITALALASLAACTTPTYATHTGYTPPPPVKPQYPVRAGQVTPLPPATPTPMVEEPAAPVAAPPNAPVESQTLPPAVAAPSPSAAPPPSASADPQPASAHVASAGDADVVVDQAGDPAAASTDVSLPDTDPEAQAASALPQAEGQPQTPPEETAQPRPARMRAGPPRLITAGKVVEAKGLFRDYEVRKHDHIDAIARELGTTRKIIVEENHLKAPYAIKPGQVLKVPVAKAYVVQAGDTLGAVGKRFGVSAGELAELNHIALRRDLRPGEKVGLPADFRDHGPTRVRSAMVADLRQEESAPPLSRRQARERAREAPMAQPEPHFAHEGPATDGRMTSIPSRPLTAEQPYVATIPPRAAPTTAEVAATSSPADIAAAAHGRFIWPVRGAILSGFGVKGLGRRNDGLDIGAAQGTVVLAAAAGDVVYAGDQVPGFGNLVLIKHEDGWVTAYAHLDKVSVQMRQQVTQGQEIGQVGMSGGATSPQVHFEIRYAPTPQDKARPIDPALVLPR